MIYENELYHHGIKGMKWGVRRFQRKDGTRTKDGKHRDKINEDKRERNKERFKSVGRIAAGTATTAAAIGSGIALSKNKDLSDRMFTPSIKGGKDRPNISPAEKMSKDAGRLVNDTQQLANSMYKVSKPKTDLSNMTDQELRNRINRLELENRYRNLSGVDVARGEKYTHDILDNVGALVGIGGGIATIATTIYTLRKDMKK